MPPRALRVAFLLTFSLIAVTAALRAEATKPSGINWLTDPELAVSTAQRMQRPILLFVTSTYCGYCRKMEQETWASTKVVAKVRSDYVPLMLDAERDEEIISRLKIEAFPTTLLFTHEGKLFGGAVGYLSPEKAEELLDPAQQPTKQIGMKQ